MSHLQALRRAFQSADQPKNGPGLYMVTLKPGCTLPGIPPSDGDILYVGKASNLKQRDHMRKRTSSCTVRRSLAVLLPELDAVPKASAGTQASNWDLEEAGNARLTEWMEVNLDVTRIRVRVDKRLSAKEQRNFLEAEERKLIGETLPPLNLRDWPEGRINPLKARIESARSGFTDQIRDTHRASRVARTRNAMANSD